MNEKDPLHIDSVEGTISLPDNSGMIANMARGLCHNRRALVVVFLLCLMSYAQSIALSAPESHHSSGHCCPLCHLGSLPYLHVTTAASVEPVVFVERLIPNPDFEASRDVLLSANSSRAPPVNLPS
jgi:hypothetical protein